MTSMSERETSPGADPNDAADVRDLIVIGGGISGASLAFAAARAGWRPLLLEREKQLGGCVHSARQADGYWLELGAHTCYNSYGGVIEMIEACGLRERITARARVPFRLLRDGALRSIPRELSFLEIALSLPRALGVRKDRETVRSFYSRLAGARNYDRVLSPLFAAVPSQNADGFPAGMLFKKRARRKDVLRSFALAGGLQTLFERLAEHDGIAARTGVEVTAVETSNSTFTLRTATSGTFAAKRLALAVPPPQAAALVRACRPELADSLERIRTARIESVAVTLPAERLTLPPWQASSHAMTSSIRPAAAIRCPIRHGVVSAFIFVRRAARPDATSESRRCSALPPQTASRSPSARSRCPRPNSVTRRSLRKSIA